MLDFWARVKTLIDKEKTTWSWLAREVGVSQQKVSQWITANRLPNSVESVQIAKLFNVTVEFLVLGEKKEIKEDVENLTGIELALIEEFRLLDQNGKTSNETANEFWQRVKELIRIQNTTQEWVAQKSQIEYSKIKQQIFHSRMPIADEAVKIAQALGTTVEYLVTGTESNKAAKELAELKARLADVLK